MSTAGRTAPESASTASDVADALRDAPFVRVVARADGDSLAAGGILARALREFDVPFQVSVARPDRLGARVAEADADTVQVVLGATESPPDGVVVPHAASRTAFEAVRELDGTADATLALAGMFAAGDVLDAGANAQVLEAARAAGTVERRPGVAVPTADLADGLAHTTLAHADVSGDPGLAQAELAELDLPVELDERAHRTVASLLALATTGVADATTRAATAVERALHPFATPDATFATVGGYADVLDTVARERPGTGVALALGHDARSDALDAWRTHANAAHTALGSATVGRYDGLFVARTDADVPVETTARLLRDFRSPEPVALVVSDDEAGVASVDDRNVGAAMRAAATATDGTGGGSARDGYARFDADTKEFIAAFREAL